MKINFSFLAILFLSCLCLPTCVDAQRKQTRDEMVLGDRDALSTDDFWIYDDFEKAAEIAKAKNKPLMIVLRCIP